MPKLMALMVLLITAMPALATVRVQKGEVKVARRTFNPARPPKEMPPPQPGEAALTEFYFACASNAAFRVTTSRSKPDEAKATITSVQVELQLTVTIWLPEGAPEKLKAHEEGHRLIAERVYNERAERAAEAAAKKIDGITFTVKGDDNEAMKKQIAGHTEQVCASYLKETADPTQGLGDIYDELTDHGRKKTPDEAKAIEQSFAREQQSAKKRRDNPTTQPGGALKPGTRMKPGATTNPRASTRHGA